jgi:hypothetical protein
MRDDLRQRTADIRSETAAAVARLIELRRAIDITIAESREALSATRETLVRAQDTLERGVKS